MTSNTSKQEWHADTYQKHANFVSALTNKVLALLDPKPGERILDLGCGDGVLTQKIDSCGAEVIGVDVSENLLASAREKNLNVINMDGHQLVFENEFDAVFSNAALHWMTEPDRVLFGIHKALKDEGRFVAEFGGHGNVAAIVTAMRGAASKFNGDLELAGPWFYPTPEEYTERLEIAGFKVQEIGLHPRPTLLPTAIEGWLMTFRKPFFDQFPENIKTDILQEVIEILRPSLCDTKGQWTADYVRIRVKAMKQSEKKS